MINFKVIFGDNYGMAPNTKTKTKITSLGDRNDAIRVDQ